MSARNQFGCTKREWDIILLLEQGLNRSEIAEEMDLNESSVRTYMQRMCDRFDCAPPELPATVRAGVSENSEVA